jgi:hypothetical protein
MYAGRRAGVPPALGVLLGHAVASVVRATEFDRPKRPGWPRSGPRASRPLWVFDRPARALSPGRVQWGQSKAARMAAVRRAGVSPALSDITIPRHQIRPPQGTGLHQAPPVLNAPQRALERDLEAKGPWGCCPPGLFRTGETAILPEMPNVAQGFPSLIQPSAGFGQLCPHLTPDPGMRLWPMANRTFRRPANRTLARLASGRLFRPKQRQDRIKFARASLEPRV